MQINQLILHWRQEMMKCTRLMLRKLYIISCIILLYGVGGCGMKKPDHPATPNAQPPSIMVNNTTGIAKSIEIDEAEYLGRISSVVNISQLPTENGQANIPFENAPYVKHEECIVVLMGEEWILFEVRDYEKN